MIGEERVHGDSSDSDYDGDDSIKAENEPGNSANDVNRNMEAGVFCM